MTIEVALILSFISVGFGVFAGISHLKRDKSKDDKEDATRVAIITTKLDNIGVAMHEIKADIKEMKEANKALNSRLIIVEQSAKSAHKRVDDLVKDGVQ